MVHLLQLITTLLFLSHAKVEAVQPELVPASVKVWNLVGAEANFINNAVKTATNPNCDQTTQRNGTTAASLTTANPFATTDVPTSTDDEDLELSEDNSTHSFGTTPTLDNTSTNSSEEVPTNTTAETFIPTDTSINDTTAAFTDETTDTAEPISKNATIDTDTSISANVTTADAEDEDAFTSATVDTATSISTDATTDDIEDVSTSAPTDDAEDAPTNATVDTATSIFTNTTADDVEAISNNATTDDTEDLLTNTTAYTIEPIPNNESIDTATSISTNAAANNAEGFLTNATTDNMVDIPTNATLEAANTTEHIPAATEQQTQDINGTATLATATDTSAHEFAEHCNVAAHFDMEKGECVCNNPEMDAKKRNPREFYRYSEGDVCYSCQGLNSTTAVVFILDESGTVKRSGWRAQKTFMQQLLDLMGDIKVGIVVIAGDSYVAVPLDDYRKNKKAIDDFVRTKRWGNKWTSIGVALYRARKMLEESTADSKNIIIFSDGDRDRCPYDDHSEDCPQWKKDNIMAHPQEDEARAIHKLGINVTFVAVKFRRSRSRIRMIAGKPKNIVKISSFTDFNERALNGVIKSVCKAEKLDEK